MLELKLSSCCLKADLLFGHLQKLLGGPVSDIQYIRLAATSMGGWRAILDPACCRCHPELLAVTEELDFTLTCIV